ncbi:MAG TPA: DNA-3-methyladenine glycosylase [Tepidisphaeraceae bacterium]|nr:DNA-3-methyladenine glycosylase [Tepidisphaeraceae bacterium]
MSLYQREAKEAARRLIGTIIVRKIGNRILRGRIVETEAYLGPIDLASHASKGRTKRTEVMFASPGHAYVYLIYGMYDMFNIVVGAVGDAHAVLIRAAEPLDGWTANLSGPGKLARGFRITRTENTTNLCTSDSLYLVQGGRKRRRILTTPRIGIDYALHWKDELLRFVDADSKAVSKIR